MLSDICSDFLVQLDEKETYEDKIALVKTFLVGVEDYGQAPFNYPAPVIALLSRLIKKVIDGSEMLYVLMQAAYFVQMHYDADVPEIDKDGSRHRAFIKKLQALTSETDALLKDEAAIEIKKYNEAVSQRNPMQPIYLDKNNVIRFKSNAIVRYILDNGGIDMNRLANCPFSDDDHQQFAQLIGYSVSGAGSLSYFDSDTVAAMDLMAANLMAGESLITELDARHKVLEEELASVRKGMLESVARLYSIDPEDLSDRIRKSS